MIDKRALLLASLHNQFLLAPAPRRVAVSSLCGLQAQFANYPKHALRLRASDHDPHAWNAGLVKTWTFRGTLHLIREDELGLYLSALGRPKKWDDGWGIDARKKPRLTRMILGWIQEGVTHREALKERCRARGVDGELLENVFHGWGGLLKEMCLRGMVAYAPGTGKHFHPCREVVWQPQREARLELLRRYFRHLGPATVEDCVVFTGIRRTSIEALLQKLPLRSVQCDGREYFHIDPLRLDGDIPHCLFLAGFDQLHLAYRDRTRLVPEAHRFKVVTNTGIIHPTVLLDGQVCAKWKLSGRTLRIVPFEPLTKKKRRSIDATALRTFQEDIDQVVIE
ncbi:MAG: winged helix DNA-binding domain-containing protein [Planctomycetaceae bacterium]|nr:winged helix DNA-binding domain-containing protein [Planctomycetaceae bacterium]